MALDGVGMHNVGVTHIGNADRGWQIGGVVFVVIGTRMPETEQGRGFANSAGAKPRARAVLRSKIEWRAQHSHIRLQRAPIRDIGRFCECGYADEWQIQATGIVVVGHVRSPCAICGDPAHLAPGMATGLSICADA